MKRTSWRFLICHVLLMLILLFIWGNSALPANLSSAVSDWVRDVLQLLFSGEGSASPGGTGLLRKVAHFLEFAALGFCLCWRFGMTAFRGLRLVCYPLITGVMVACIDEGIQFFVPGRSCSWMDVGIDTAGVLTGLVFLLIGFYFTKFRKNKNSSEEN